MESAITFTAKAICLVHTLVQDGHDTDVAIRETPPVDEVMLVPEVEALNAERGWDWPRRHAMALDPVETVISFVSQEG